MDSIGSKLYAGKRRRRPAKRSTIPANGNVKTNPSKRHRDRLNAELDRLASLLPFDSDTVTKLDKLSILRLSVSYLRSKSYFQGTRDRDLFQNGLGGGGNGGRRFLTSSSSSSSTTEGAVVGADDALPFLEEEAHMHMQALNGFIIVIQNDGQIFYASPSIQEYLGFQDADVMHQNVFELIHKEDREDFQKQLLLHPATPTCAPDVNQPAITNSDLHPDLTDGEPNLDRHFTSRLRCLLDESSGFLSLQISGRLRMLHGQRTRGTDGIPVDVDPPEMALFAIASPLQQPSIMEIYVRNMIFRTKHKLDFKTVNLDVKATEVLGYSDNEFRCLPGYQYIHYEDIIYCSEMHSSLIRKGETGFIYFRLMSKTVKWIWVQAKGRVIYKNGKPDYLVSTHRPMSDEEGKQHLTNRRKPFKFPFQGKAELYDCNPPYPPIPAVILRALQRGEIPSFGDGPPPGMSMGDMPPGMGGMPPGMPPGMGGMPPGMPPGMGGMPPGMGGMPPGMGDFMPPGGMSPFAGPMPFGDGGPPPFVNHEESMFGPKPDQGADQLFDRGGATRYPFKRSPAYSPPSYSFEGAAGMNGMSSHMDSGFDASEWMSSERKGFLENGIKGHISPQGPLSSPVVCSTALEVSGNFGSDCSEGMVPSNSFSPRSITSSDSGFNSSHLNGSELNDHASYNSGSRKVAIVSPCQSCPAAQETVHKQPALSTGSLDSAVDTLPFESGEDIPTFEEALSLSTVELEKKGVLAENFLMNGDHDISTTPWNSVNGQTFTSQNHAEEFPPMPNQIGPKVELNAMHSPSSSQIPSDQAAPSQDSCHVLRSLLSNQRPKVVCKQEVPSSTSPVTSLSHPNTVEWRNSAPNPPAVSQHSVHSNQPSRHAAVQKSHPSQRLLSFQNSKSQSQIPVHNGSTPAQSLHTHTAQQPPPSGRHLPAQTNLTQNHRDFRKAKYTAQTVIPEPVSMPSMNQSSFLPASQQSTFQSQQTLPQLQQTPQQQPQNQQQMQHQQQLQQQQQQLQQQQQHLQQQLHQQQQLQELQQQQQILQDTRQQYPLTTSSVSVSGPQLQQQQLAQGGQQQQQQVMGTQFQNHSTQQQQMQERQLQKQQQQQQQLMLQGQYQGPQQQMVSGLQRQGQAHQMMPAAQHQGQQQTVIAGKQIPTPHHHHHQQQQQQMVPTTGVSHQVQNQQMVARMQQQQGQGQGLQTQPPVSMVRPQSRNHQVVSGVQHHMPQQQQQQQMVSTAHRQHQQPAQQNFDYQMNGGQQLEAHPAFPTGSSHQGSHHVQLQGDQMGYHGNQGMLQDVGVTGVGFDMSQTQETLYSSNPPIRSQADLMTPDFLSTMVPSMLDDHQGLFDLPLKGMNLGGGHLLQNSHIGPAHLTNA